MTGHIFGHHNLGEDAVASSGPRPWMLLNILPCIGQFPQQRMMWPQMSVAKVQKPSLHPMLPEASIELPYFFFLAVPEPHFLELPLWSPSCGNSRWSGVGKSGLEMAGRVGFFQDLDMLLWRVSLRPWRLEDIVCEGDTEGTIRTSYSPESCSADSAPLSLQSFPQR